MNIYFTIREKGKQKPLQSIHYLTASDGRLHQVFFNRMVSSGVAPPRHTNLTTKLFLISVLYEQKIYISKLLKL
jgi:hypothetical protein